MWRTPTLLSLLALALVVLGPGCAQKSEPSKFFVLSYPQGEEEAAAATTMREGVSLGIGPVELPQYLDRSPIVTRNSHNRLEVEEFHRWGGRLTDNFTIVLAEVLSNELSTDRISLYPWNSPAQVKYQVAVHVTAFDTDQAGRSILDARWSVIDAQQMTVLATARSRLRQDIAAGTGSTPQDAGYDAIAAAMSRNVADLAREISRQIRLLPGS